MRKRNKYEFFRIIFEIMKMMCILGMVLVESPQQKLVYSLLLILSIFAKEKTKTLELK